LEADIGRRLARSFRGGEGGHRPVGASRRVERVVQRPGCDAAHRRRRNGRKAWGVRRVAAKCGKGCE
jgi:hypothetical protein